MHLCSSGIPTPSLLVQWKDQRSEWEKATIWRRQKKRKYFSFQHIKVKQCHFSWWRTFWGWKSMLQTTRHQLSLSWEYYTQLPTTFSTTALVPSPNFGIQFYNIPSACNFWASLYRHLTKTKTIRDFRQRILCSCAVFDHQSERILTTGKFPLKQIIFIFIFRRESYKNGIH